MIGVSASCNGVAIITVQGATRTGAYPINVRFFVMGLHGDGGAAVTGEYPISVRADHVLPERMEGIRCARSSGCRCPTAR